MSARQMGQPECISVTVRAQLSQNRAWPHGTRAYPSRGATRQTSHCSDWSVSTDGDGAETVPSDAADVLAAGALMARSSDSLIAVTGAAGGRL